jgi:fibronectin-binding autotransporter adhesin
MTTQGTIGKTGFGERKMRLLSVVMLIGFGLLTQAQAQTNFTWTNSFDGVWSGAFNWTNELANGNAPAVGGSSGYIVTFDPGTTNAFNSTNDLGTAANGGFVLNELAFNSGVPTLWGSSLVFVANSSAALPQVLQNGNNTVTINNGLKLGANTTFGGTGTGAIQLKGAVSSSGGLTMNGNYLLQLNAASSYTGPTVVNSGTLYAAAGDALDNNASLIVSNGATVKIANALQIVGDIQGSGTLLLQAGFMEAGSDNASTTYSGVITDGGLGGNLYKEGTGTLTLNNPNDSWTGQTYIYGGTLALRANNIIPNTGSVAFHGTSTTFDIGSTTQSVGWVDSITASTTETVIDNGALIIGGKEPATGGAFYGQMTGSGSVTITNGTGVGGGAIGLGYQFAGAIQQKFTGGLTISNAYVVLNGTTVNQLPIGGALTIEGGGTLDTQAANVLQTVGTFTLMSGGESYKGIYSSSNGFFLQSGVVYSSLEGIGGLEKDTVGTVVLSNRSSYYTGGTVVNNGLLQLYVSSLPTNGAVTVNGGTLDLGGQGPMILGNVLLTGGTIADGSASGSVYNVQSGEIDAKLTGVGALTKSNGGTVVLTSNNTYTGSTIINAGTLQLTGIGAIGVSNIVNVASGANLDVSGLTSTFTLGAAQTLKGNGTVVGNATIGSAGGVLAPGDTNVIGALTFTSNLTLAGTTLIKLDTDLATNDIVDVGGTIAYGGTLTVTNIGVTALAAGDVFQVFVFGNGQQSGDFGVTNLPTLSAGLSWNTTELDSQGTLTIVPEPSAWALVILGLAVVFRCVRRRSSGCCN